MVSERGPAYGIPQYSLIWSKEVVREFAVGAIVVGHIADVQKIVGRITPLHACGLTCVPTADQFKGFKSNSLSQIKGYQLTTVPKDDCGEFRIRYRLDLESSAQRRGHPRVVALSNNAPEVHFQAVLGEAERHWVSTSDALAIGEQRVIKHVVALVDELGDWVREILFGRDPHAQIIERAMYVGWHEVDWCTFCGRRPCRVVHGPKMSKTLKP